MAEAFKQAWRNFVDLVAWFVQALGIIVPLGGLATAAWLGARRWHKAPAPRTAEGQDRGTRGRSVAQRDTTLPSFTTIGSPAPRAGGLRPRPLRVNAATSGRRVSLKR